MSKEHPITPPPELVQQWLGEFFGCTVNGELSDSERYLATEAARWGSDQELDACCEWLGREVNSGWGLGTQLRAARRPKPPSLREQALEMLECIPTYDSGGRPNGIDVSIIRRALEQLDD